jgi:hypothetical protein
MICCVGNHALARWFQRSFVNTNEALIAALGAVARSEMAPKNGGDEFEIAGVDGVWRGIVMQTSANKLIPAIRTFV